MKQGLLVYDKRLLTKKIKLQLDKIIYTVKLEMFADINVCEFIILKVFALLMFEFLGLSKVNLYSPQTVFC